MKESAQIDDDDVGSAPIRPAVAIRGSAKAAQQLNAGCVHLMFFRSTITIPIDVVPH